MKKIIIIGGIILLCVGGAYALSNRSSPQDSPSGSASTEDAVATDQVIIQNFAYEPKTITVKAGTTVTWTNKDTVQHNVVGDELSELKGPLLDKGASYSYTFDEPGTYPYHCGPHPNMQGVVIVTS